MNKRIGIGIVVLGIVLGFGYWFFSKEALVNYTIVTVEQHIGETEVVDLTDGEVYALTVDESLGTIGKKEQLLYTYNNSFPGPVFRAKQGTSATLAITNKLSEETLLHPHGLRLENEFDGTPIVQDPIKPGETFLQTLSFPDPGVYWYHTHLREDKQQELGLYGMIIVEPEDPSYFSEVHEEVPFFVDDVYIVGGGIAAFHDEPNRTLMGRFGNTMLVNGTDDYIQHVAKGSVIRYYIGNAANTRTFDISFSGARMKLVGGDGGRVEKELFVDSVVVAPSERVIVDVLFDTPGTVKIFHTTPQNRYVLGDVVVSENDIAPSLSTTFEVLRTNQEIAGLREAYDAYFSKPADKRLRIGIDMDGMMAMMRFEGGGHMTGVPCHTMPDGTLMGDCGDDVVAEEISHSDPIEWEDAMAVMNGHSDTSNVTWKLIDEATGKANEAIDWDFKMGDLVKISIFNDPNSLHPMQHPIHFHGQRFLVLAVNGDTNDTLVWKDTVLVKNGDRTDILLEVSNPGEWMAHCHIAEHLESGMMLMYNAS